MGLEQNEKMEKNKKIMYIMPGRLKPINLKTKSNPVQNFFFKIPTGKNNEFDKLKNKKKDIVIFDTTKIVSLYRVEFDNILEEEISKDILDLIESRRENYEYSGKIVIKDKEYVGSFIFNSIIPNGDVLGGVLIYSKNDRFNDSWNNFGLENSSK